MAENKKEGVQSKVAPFIVGALIVGGVWMASSYLGSSYLGVALPESDYGVSTDSVYPPMFSSTSKTGTNVVGNTTQDRKVTQNYLSIHVTSVVDYHKEVTAYVQQVKGKVMSEDISESSDTQAEKGMLRVLVPNAEAEKFLEYLESKSIKVVDQSVTSYEITQEYTDIERKLSQYESTYTKILAYYDSAKSVSDLLSIQQQLDQVQSMIDSLKGRKMALEELSDNTQYTIYSSTSEYDLPYIPDGTFQVRKTFKLAVRALIGVADGLMSLVIYILVFSPLVALLWGVYLGVKRLLVGKKS